MRIPLLSVFREMMLAGVASLVVAAIVAWPVYRLLLAVNSRQKVAEFVPEHASKQGTPTMGGLIMLAGIAAGVLAVGRPESLPALLLVAGFGLVGFLDDFVLPRLKPGSRGLGWKPKLLLEVLAVGGAYLALGRTDPAYLLVALFVVLFFSNAYNFADGMDALAGSLAVLLAAGFAAVALLGGTGYSAAPVLVAIAASCLPFLFLNAPPAKVFMGDVAALPIGALFGWAFLEVVAPGTKAFNPAMLAPMLIASLVMVAELVPAPLQILSVKLRKGKRLFKFQTPIHHGMQHAGWPESRVVWTLILVQALCIVLAVAAPTVSQWWPR